MTQKIAQSDPRNHNSRGYAKHGAMLDKTKELLDTFYGSFNKRLADLLNDNGFLWES